MCKYVSIEVTMMTIGLVIAFREMMRYGVATTSRLLIIKGFF